MLPALPTPTSAGSVPAASGLSPGPLGRWRQGLAGLVRWLRAVTAATHPSGSLPRLLTALLLVVLLTGCGTASQPPRRVVLDALALQIRLTQDQVAEALRLQPGGLPEVSRVRVEQQQAIAIGDARGLRLTGRFDWRLAADPIRVDSPFELYLQRGERGQSWRLARPVGGTEGAVQSWLTEPLPLPGERPAAGPASGSDAAG